MITERLALIPATVALCDAEAVGAAAVGSALGVEVPASWPPPVFEGDDVVRIRGQLAASPSIGDWTLHYLLRRAEQGATRPTLVGIAGYAAPPSASGSVEIGYAIAVEHQRRGYATEAVEALVAHAFTDPRVRVIVATTYPSLEASIAVLQKTGFTDRGLDPDTGVLRFERVRDLIPR